MNEIRYRIFGDTAVVAAVTAGGEGLRIVTEPQTGGFIRLGERTLRIEDGAVEAGRIADGEYAPTLITAQREIRLPSISVEDGRVRAAKLGDGDLHRLVLGIFELGERVAALESEIGRIGGMINRKINF